MPDKQTFHIDFLIAGNDNPQMAAFNLKKIRRHYPDSTVYLYDWGYQKKYLEEFSQCHKRLKIIDWKRANVTNYMYHKVLCISDYYQAGHKNKLVYMDTDVIIYRPFHKIYAEPWDVAAIWRPDYHVYFDTEQWLNAGTIFFNDLNLNHIGKFLSLWKRQCDRWENKAWWLDQVELINIFKNVNERFREAPGLTDILSLDDAQIKLKTFSWTRYNFYPGANYPRDASCGKVKIVHFKSPGRKKIFNLLPEPLIEIWLRSLGRKLFEPLFQVFLQGLDLSVKTLRYGRRRYYRLKFGKDSELYYWKHTALKHHSLYDFTYYRAREIMKIFSEIAHYTPPKFGPRILDIGPGPGGGVLDVLEAEEKWAVEPVYDDYVRNNIWIAKSKPLHVRTTTAEQMDRVPEDYFDSVFAINSLDHGKSIRQGLENIYKGLKKEGLFYLHVHCRTPAQTNHLHVQSFDPNELQMIIKETGFSIEHHRIFPEDPLSGTYTTFIGILKKI